jgi:glycopeptide antibiotics resistance protein
MRLANAMAIKNRSRVVPWIVTGAIALALAWITLGHTGSISQAYRFQFVPFVDKFKSLACMLTHCMPRRYWLKNFLIDVVGNVMIFIPFGAAALVALRHHSRPWLKATLLGLALSLTFETAQIWIPGRTVATDDLLLNTFGAALGAWFSAGILSIYRASAPPANGPDPSPYSSADGSDSSRP